MEAAHLVEEDGHEFNASVGCKAEGKSTAVTPYNCLLLLTLTAMYTPVCANEDSYLN